MKIEPIKDNLEKVTAYVEQTLEAQDAPMKTITSMSIAADEIFSNIVYYSGASEATVTCSYDGSHAVLVFADNGSAYNPLEKEDPDITVPLEEREVGGLGVFMVKKMMQEVKYCYKDGMNQLELTSK